MCAHCAKSFLLHILFSACQTMLPAEEKMLGFEEWCSFANHSESSIASKWKNERSSSNLKHLPADASYWLWMPCWHVALDRFYFISPFMSACQSDVGDWRGNAAIRKLTPFLPCTTSRNRWWRYHYVLRAMMFSIKVTLGFGRHCLLRVSLQNEEKRNASKCPRLRRHLSKILRWIIIFWT